MYFCSLSEDTHESKDICLFFPTGKRKCLGEKVAKNTIFLFLANLMKDFKFSVSDKLPLNIFITNPMTSLPIS